MNHSIRMIPRGWEQIAFGPVLAGDKYWKGDWYDIPAGNKHLWKSLSPEDGHNDGDGS